MGDLQFQRRHYFRCFLEIGRCQAKAKKGKLTYSTDDTVSITWLLSRRARSLFLLHSKSFKRAVDWIPFGLGPSRWCRLFDLGDLGRRQACEQILQIIEWVDLMP